MVVITPNQYKQLPFDSLLKGVQLQDHICGFDEHGNNTVLSDLQKHAQSNNKIYDVSYHQVLPDHVKKKYPNLKIKFSPELQEKMNFMHFKNYTIHPELTFRNFLSCFNGSPHVSRKLLTSAIKKFNFWSDYCSKNFSYTEESIDGHIKDYCHDRHRFYSKFFSIESEFSKSVYGFHYDRFDHSNNVYTLQSKLSESFLHLVSETMGTSYYPFVTEKFLYSVVTRGLFLSYAQPGWHDHLERYYGFQQYNHVFDYRFDTIQNPVERLVELMTMISKFSMLSADDWRDLYLMESDTIEYNYDHYFSQGYLDFMQKHV